MYKYAGAENQQHKCKTSLENFTIEELCQELKKRVNAEGIDIVGKLPQWLNFRIVAETYEQMFAHRDEFEDDDEKAE